MKTQIQMLALASLLLLGVSCQNQATSTQESPASTQTSGVGQSGVKDDVSNPNVVQVAASSPDHSTLVEAVKAAGLVDALTNAGPFTVFAPTNEAFKQLPAGTVEGLLKPDKKNDLIDILQYHVYVGVLNAESLADGQTLGQVNGGNIKITKNGDEILVNGKARIIGSVKAANGVVHVIDQVLLPQ